MREYCREYNKEYNQRPEVKKYKREYQKEWKERNPEYQKEWHKRNPEYTRQHFQLTKDKLYERRRVQRGSPEMRLNNNMAVVIWMAIKQNKAGRKWESLVGYTLQDLMRHLERLFTPEMSWQNYGSYWWLDHIRPRSLFSFMIAEEQAFKDCWALENLQPLEKIANIIKGNKFLKVVN